MGSEGNWADFGRNLQGVLKRDRIIYLIVILQFLATTYMNLRYAPYVQFDAFLYWDVILQATLIMAVFLLVGYFIYLAINRHTRPAEAFRQRFRDIVSNPHEVIAFMAMMVAIVVFHSAFTGMKSMIPSINPFQYDVLFANLDQTLHFGFQPWQLTHALFSSPTASGIINSLYNTWFVVYWVVLMFFVTKVKDRQIRLHYIVSFILCWILIGNVGAVLMSSAGPCYYGLVVGGEDQFSHLMELLRSQNDWLLAQDNMSITALNTQDRLWGYYTTDTTGLGNGISAMPSMHVSVSVLMALGISKLSRKWGYAFWGYALMIQFGSVHLGWHYAIDGYLSLGLTLLIWKLVGYFYPAETGKTSSLRLGSASQ